VEGIPIFGRYDLKCFVPVVLMGFGVCYLLANRWWFQSLEEDGVFVSLKFEEWVVGEN
jgi:hypothetical protein